jgi:hypothetical protein
MTLCLHRKMKILAISTLYASWESLMCSRTVPICCSVVDKNLIAHSRIIRRRMTFPRRKLAPAWSLECLCDLLCPMRRVLSGRSQAMLPIAPFCLSPGKRSLHGRVCMFRYGSPFNELRCPTPIRSLPKIKI